MDGIFLVPARGVTLTIHASERQNVILRTGVLRMTLVRRGAGDGRGAPVQNGSRKTAGDMAGATHDAPRISSGDKHLQQPSQPASNAFDLPVDYRVALAQKKRETTRLRILEATMHVFARINDDAPVIEDVVREAGIARGTFYKHFESLDQAVVAASKEANDRMIADILPLYDCLKEPWQRSSVGFRVYMVRALQDAKWGAFMARMEAWSHESLITRYMTEDFRRGRELGQFRLDDVDAAVDFFKGASSGGVFAICRGVADPDSYMDAAVRLAMHTLACTPELTERAVAFSRKHLADWRNGVLSAWTPL